MLQYPHRVILRSPYIGNKFLSPSQYKQMVGRAGRSGKCDVGESILVAHRADKEKVRLSREGSPLPNQCSTVLPFARLAWAALVMRGDGVVSFLLFRFCVSWVSCVSVSKFSSKVIFSRTLFFVRRRIFVPVEYHESLASPQKRCYFALHCTFLSILNWLCSPCWLWDRLWSSYVDRVTIAPVACCVTMVSRWLHFFCCGVQVFQPSRDN